MTAAILTLNAGSSSLKFALYEARDGLTQKAALCVGQISGIGDRARFRAQDGSGAYLMDEALAGEASHEHALTALLAWFEERFAGMHLIAAGHRIAHGGARFTAPVIVDPGIMRELRSLVPLAPLHQQHNLAAIDALRNICPSLSQIACFDTAFHHTQPALATAFALPRMFRDEGIRRYGFHGLSYEYIAGVLPEVMGVEGAEGRVIVAHLGSGASLCAMQKRKSVATTMGFTALDGLMMARRCGSIDPGVITYLLQQRKMSAEDVSDLLYNLSGLLGVSGTSDDMRVLLASSDPRAKEAIDLFVYRIGRELGSLAAALGGLDALVFTAGIGEHAAEIRRRVCTDAAWLGVELDAASNMKDSACIAFGKVTAWVLPTDEDLVIARHTWNLASRLVRGQPFE